MKERLLKVFRLARRRTLLANERTMLAYARTAFALAVAGLGVLKFFAGTLTYAIATVFIGGAVVVLIIGIAFFVQRRTRIHQQYQLTNAKQQQ